MTSKQKFQFSVGAYECTAIRDGENVGTAAILFTNAPQDQLAEVLGQHHLTADQLPGDLSCLLVNTGEQLLLIDTGYGTGLPPGKGRLLRNLGAHGVDPAQIDTVVLTHGHPDHIGGCVDGDGRLIFPNARFIMLEAEWQFWTSEEQLTQLSPGFNRYARWHLPRLRDRINLSGAGDEIFPGVRLVAAPGHTPGHAAVEISSQDETLYFLADTALHPIHLEHPGWVAIVDMDADQVVSTRHHLLDQVANESCLVHFFHFPFPGLGYVRTSGDRWRWEPLSVSA